MLENSKALTDIATKNAARLRARTKKFNLAILGSNIAVVAGILGIIVVGYRAPVEASQAQSASSILEQPVASVDQIAAADVASVVATTADMAVEHNVQSLAISLTAKTELAQTDSSFLAKPQIVGQDSGRQAITKYTTKQGDTVQSVAAAFGVSDDSIRWSNNLTSDAIPGGRELLIPGTTGVIYTVKSGDDAAKLAEKFRADKDRIITYNDAELTGLKVGQQIVVPGGILPDNERPGARGASRAARSVSISPLRVTVFGGNGYAYGYCTYYAYNRRAELGRPIGGNWGNAVTWASYARAAGFRVDRIPEAGAIIQNGGGWGGYGHVGVVERVNADGSLFVSDMNYAGWNKISTRTVPASQVGSYSYIH
ncbi:MAG: CHAP domain-containing protein [Candidatus Saccharimonadales bacterium]